MRILVVEDDAEIAGFLLKALREAGHVAEHAPDGRQGLFLATGEAYDAIVLDRLLPKMDGLAMLAALRATGSRVPVLILSALGQVDERIKGLRAGGDDYLVKPFAIAELLARLEAITRRGLLPAAESRLRVADLELDRLAHVVKRGGEVIGLKPQEYRVLEFLMRHAGQVVTRTMLLEGVWDYHFDPQTNVIDVHVSRLRAKIDREPRPALIHTLRGAGYCLREPQ
ncbi:DNA-binding response regulator [Stagnimonas aquatica]|uniref:DNA-binding response regulator n=1 Tax=Stagnimonas aquatica TaxID=2689987 RepID=A0A3N0VLQ1_9GAMM|nr:response regulator transcription factor [Stagnimonas aquatica]ROH93641.1 DNA-binding response regulator [Stagnimonas aquatica]